jgi:hypothetical protein
LRRDIVTLPPVRPSHPCEPSRINILQWILTKLGTYLVLKRIWNHIDFQGCMSKINVIGSNVYRITSLWTLESTSFNGFLTKLGTYLVLKRIWNPIDFQSQRSRSPGQIFRRGDTPRFALVLFGSCKYDL